MDDKNLKKIKKLNLKNEYRIKNFYGKVLDNFA